MAKRGRPRKYPLPIPAPAPISESTHETVEPTLDTPDVPADWHPGMLLNVRNVGDSYNVTLWPEEFDTRHPGRCLRFTNTAEAQNFRLQFIK